MRLRPLAEARKDKASVGILLQERLIQSIRPIGAKCNCYAGCVSIETLLGMARRHVRDGTERVAQQEGLVAALDRDTRYRPQAALAREILASLHISLDLRKSRLQAIEDRSKRVTCEADHADRMIRWR